MKNRKLAYVALATALVYIVMIIVWHLRTPGGFELQNPGADNRPEGLERKADDVVIGEYFMSYEEGFATSLEGEWTNFRGKSHDNIINTGQKGFLEGDFPEVWSFETGEGHAAPVIWKGRVYVLDYVESMNSDALRCFSLETGKELWRRWYRVPMKRNHGFSRTIPAVGEGYIITVGPQGHVMCCDPITGDLKWTLDMQKEYGSEIPFWYTGQCPFVENGVLVVAPSGTEVLLAGLDCMTGETVWTTPNTVNFKMSHSSVQPMVLSGVKTYVYAGVGGVCGVAAEGPSRGKLLWSTSKWQPSVIAPSPVRIASDRILMVAGYGTGGAMINVSASGGTWSATVTDQYKANEGLACEQQTPIMYDGMIITVIPKDGGSYRGRLACYSPSDLRNPIWNSAAEERFGLGPYLMIDGHLFVFKDDGELYVYKAGKGSMELLRSQRIMEGADAWGPMAYADGMLILRDAHNVKCIRIR